MNLSCAIVNSKFSDCVIDLRKFLTELDRILVMYRGSHLHIPMRYYSLVHGTHHALIPIFVSEISSPAWILPLWINSEGDIIVGIDLLPVHIEGEPGRFSNFHNIDIEHTPVKKLNHRSVR